MSGGTSDTGEVAITISAVDQASEVIQNVQSNLSDLTTTADSVGPAMTDVAGSTTDATDSMDGLNQSTMWSMQGMMGLSSTLRMGISDYERMEMMHIRIEASTEAVQKAQEAYNAAVQKYGENSQQASLALETLQTDEDRLNYYQQRNLLNYVQMGLQIPMIIASITQMAGSLGGLGGALGSAGDAIGGVVAALGPVGIAIIAIIAAVALLYEAWTNDWGGIREITANAVKDIQSGLEQVGNTLNDFADAVKVAIGGAVDWLKSNWQDVLVAALTGPVGLAYEAWKNNWGGFRDVVSDAITVIGNTLGTMKDTIAKPVQDAWTSVVDSTTTAWDQIKDKVNQQMPLMGGIIQTGMDVIHGNWQVAWQDLANLPNALLTQMQKDISEIMDNIKTSIKVFTDAFQAADDLLKPILTDIATALTDFLKAIEDLFTDFYNWLVGASLWNDLWNAILDMTEKAITDLLEVLQTKLFDAMQDAFTKALQLVEDLWSKAWSVIRDAFTATSTAISDDLNAWFKAVEANFTTATDLLQTVWQSAWQTMQSTFQTISDDIKDAWKDFLDTMNQAMNSFWSATELATQNAFEDLEGAFTAAMDAIEGILSGAISTMEDAWSAFSSFISSGVSQVECAVSGAAGMATSTFTSMQGSTGSALSGIEKAVSGTVNNIASAATDLWNALVGHSIWTDMLQAMEDQATDAMTNILKTFTGGFGAIAPAVPSATGGGAINTAITTALQQLAGGKQISITIPVTLQVDGQTFSRTVERRIVNKITATSRTTAPG